MKKIIILENNNGRLANQLWLYSNVYAYCLEKKYLCENPSFYRYNKYFSFDQKENIISLTSYFSIKLAKILYFIYSNSIKIANPTKIIKNNDLEFLLPPDISKNTNHQKQLLEIDSRNNNFYFCGWLFKTQIGLEKYRDEIKKHFRPKKEHLKKIDEIINPLKSSNKHLVGVHIRHGDYKNWNGGIFFYSFEEVKKILKSYLINYSEPEKVVFVICSDNKIDPDMFNGFNYVFGDGNEVEDLYLLASTDIILGSNSTFGAWAAYYGNIPFITFSR